MSPKAKTLRLAGARGLIRRWVLCYHRIAGSGIRRLLDAKREGTPRPSCIFFFVCVFTLHPMEETGNDNDHQTTLSTCVLFFRLLRNVSGQIRHLHACRLLGGRAIRPYVTLFRVCFAVHSHIMTCTCTFSGHSPVRRLSLCAQRGHATDTSLGTNLAYACQAGFLSLSLYLCRAQYLVEFSGDRRAVVGQYARGPLSVRLLYLLDPVTSRISHSPRLQCPFLFPRYHAPSHAIVVDCAPDKITHPPLPPRQQNCNP